MKTGWEEKPLGDVCDFRGGGTPSKAVARYWSGDIPWVSPKDMKSDIVTDSIDHITNEAISNSSASLIPAGAVLVVVRSGILNRTIPLAIAGRPLSINQDVKALCPSSDLDPSFLLYFLRSKESMILGMVGRGATVHRLLADQLRQIPVPVPPLPEQRRIVAILDEAFEGIAAAKANAERNLSNTRTFFESYLAKLFGECGPSVPLDAVAEEITDGDHMPPPKAKEGVPFITISDIDKETREIDFGATFFVPRVYFDQLKPNKRPRRGDVLYTVTGATLGIPALVREDKQFCFQRHIALVRPSKDTDSGWLEYALLAPQTFRQATIGATGTAQKTVSLKLLRSLLVPKVTLSDQRRMADAINAVQAQARRLARNVCAALTALDELKASLLHQAFTGQL